jgi:hypothetical protein
MAELTEVLSRSKFDRYVSESVRREFPLGVGQGDYSAERHEWIDRLTLEEILAGPQQQRRPRANE